MYCTPLQKHVRRELSGSDDADADKYISSGATCTVNVPDISSVSIASKIPDFWPENPRLWFRQVKAILTPQKHRILHGFVHPYIILSFTPTTTFGSIQVI